MSHETPPLSPFRASLATPHIAEATHEELGEDLTRALLPLLVYCEQQEDRDDLSNWQADRVAEIRAALEALVTYNGQAEELLATYRAGLAAAQELLTARVPTLEQAVAIDWERTARRFAQLATLPPSRPLSPLELRCRWFLLTAGMQARLALPLDHRRALASVTSNDLRANG